MRLLLASLACALFLGCSDDLPPNPQAFLGEYNVTITANGKSDPDHMTVSLASSGGVLLDFVYGISQIRCGVIGSTNLTIPAQTLHISHSTGVADGEATGEGTLSSDGQVTITLQLTGTGTVDGGAATTTYVISGTRNQ